MYPGQPTGIILEDFFGYPKKKIQFFKKKQLFFKTLFGKRFVLYLLFLQHFCPWGTEGN